MLKETTTNNQGFMPVLDKATRADLFYETIPKINYVSSKHTYLFLVFVVIIKYSACYNFHHVNTEYSACYNFHHVDTKWYKAFSIYGIQYSFIIICIVVGAGVVGVTKFLSIFVFIWGFDSFYNHHFLRFYHSTPFSEILSFYPTPYQCI